MNIYEAIASNLQISKPIAYLQLKRVKYKNYLDDKKRRCTNRHKGFVQKIQIAQPIVSSPCKAGSKELKRVRNDRTWWTIDGSSARRTGKNIMPVIQVNNDI